MRARSLLLALLVVAAALAGCTQGVEDRLRGEEAPTALHAPDERLFDVIETNVTIVASDGVDLQATLFSPDPFAPDERFPAVVFVHGWGNDRSMRGSFDAPGEGALADVMRTFARDGYHVLAYDVRGFGESGGVSTLAGAREMQDLREVIDWLVNATSWNGHLGVTGYSYGGGHSWWALVHDERVDTVVPHYGWIDLADGLAPGGIPKHGWITALLVIGAMGQGEYDPVIYDWAQRAYLRDDVEPVLEALRERSVLSQLANVTKPVLIVEGTDETLFPQALQAYDLLDNSPMRKLFLYTGGHGSQSPDGWERTRLWFDRWLKLEDSGVESWPALVMPGLDGDGAASVFDDYPAPGGETLELWLADDTPGDGEGALADAPAEDEARAGIVGSGRGGLFDDPSVLRDAFGARGVPAPTTVRAAPGEAVVLRSDPLGEPLLLIGNPRLDVTFAPGAAGGQLTARLYDEAPDGTARLLARGGIDGTGMTGDNAVSIDLTRALARVEGGHRLALLLAGDDALYSAPYPRPFVAEVAFGGETDARLLVPVVRA